MLRLTSYLRPHNVRANVAQVELALGRDALQRLKDLVLAAIEVGFAGFLHIQPNEHFIGSLAESLNAGAVQTSFVQGSTDGIFVGLVRELYEDVSASAKIQPARDSVPQGHGKNAGHAEDQREAEEVPLFAEKIYVRIAKKFHLINL